MSTVPRTRVRRPAAAQEQAIEQPLGFLGTVGDMTAFGARGFAEIRHVGRFGSEVLRQGALIATGSVFVLMIATFLIGAACAQTTSAAARALGVEQFGAAVAASCGTRNAVPFLFGFILAAKTGCGIVAEIGSMRVREEIDALETMGTRPIPFLVSTRILGATLVLPFAFWLSIAASHLGAYLMGVLRYGDVSQGSYEFYFYGFLDASDLLFVLAQGLILSATIVSVALYFGYRVRGGPVEVGVATARSMAVNLTLATLINLTMTVAFLLRPQIPIA